MRWYIVNIFLISPWVNSTILVHKIFPKFSMKTQITKNNIIEENRILRWRGGRGYRNMSFIISQYRMEIKKKRVYRYQRTLQTLWRYLYVCIHLMFVSKIFLFYLIFFYRRWWRSFLKVSYRLQETWVEGMFLNNTHWVEDMFLHNTYWVEGMCLHITYWVKVCVYLLHIEWKTCFYIIPIEWMVCVYILHIEWRYVLT